jgi:RHS repeat-associated protein
VRTNNYRTYLITQRDGAGRVLQTATKLRSNTNLTETLSWRNDGRLSSYTANRVGDFTDNRSYAYAPFSQRLMQEIFNVSSIQQFTNNYTYDYGQPGGLGVLTSMGTPAQSTNTWSAPSSGGLDGLNRVAKEQTAILRRPATGLALGAATVSATLDGGPVNVQFDGTAADGRWRAMLDMTPGSHTLRLAAVHPSGEYAAYATNTFNTIGGADTVTNVFNGSANVTQRVWITASGQINHTQTFTWDGFDRLIKVSERDSVSSGQDWVAIYDGLGRKVRTLTTLVVSNAPITSPANAISTVDSWFDPQVEFQEVGTVINGGVFNMKTYGPDANGVHGGMNGVGGLERVTPYGHISGIGLIQDFFGNIVGSVTNAASGVAWNPARFSSYGPVPGYQQTALTLNGNLAQAVGWRGKWMETVGTFNWGARPYEPGSGRFLAHDPTLDMANLGGFSLCGGDPLNQFDPDARFVKGAAYGIGGVMQHYSTMANNVIDAIMNRVVGLFDPVAAKMYFLGGHEGGPSYGSLLNGSTASQVGYFAGYAAAEATVQFGIFTATAAAGEILGGGEVAGIGATERAAFGTEARVVLGEEEEAAGQNIIRRIEFNGEANAATAAQRWETAMQQSRQLLNAEYAQFGGPNLAYGKATPAATQLEFDFVNELGPANAQTAALRPAFSQSPQGQLLAAYARIEPYHIGTGTPTTDAARVFARGLGLPTDDAGHAIGNNLGGLGGVTSGNIFPQAPSVNRGAFAQFEQQIARQVLAGNEVFVGVVPQYAPGATRPFSISYQVSVNGIFVRRIFPNP